MEDRPAKIAGHEHRHADEPQQFREEYDFDLPSLWTRSYFVSSAAEVSSQTIEEYIETQIGQ